MSNPPKKARQPPKRRKTLTKEQRKALYKPPENNAGVGWGYDRYDPTDPIAYENGKPSRKADL